MSNLNRSGQERDPNSSNTHPQRHQQSCGGKAWALLRYAPSHVRRGILFYWYTGERRIAIAGALVSTILYLVVLWVLGAKSVFALVLLMMMDHLLIIFMILYVFAVRPLFPGFLASWQGNWMPSLLPTGS